MMLDIPHVGMGLDLPTIQGTTTHARPQRLARSRLSANITHRLRMLRLTAVMQAACRSACCFYECLFSMPSFTIIEVNSSNKLRISHVYFKNPRRFNLYQAYTNKFEFTIWRYFFASTRLHSWFSSRNISVHLMPYCTLSFDSNIDRVR